MDEAQERRRREAQAQEAQVDQAVEALRRSGAAKPVTPTRFIMAETTPAAFAALTGLEQGNGFTVQGGRPTGLYPEAMAMRLCYALQANGVRCHMAMAATYREGTARLEEMRG